MIKNKRISEMLKSDYLSSQEITDLVIKYQSARRSTKKQEYKDLVFDNVVRMISKRASQCASKHRNLDMEDLFQAGVIGFCEALEKFKPKKKFMFSTYLDFWIKKYMYDLAYDDNIIYTPKSVIQYAFQQEKLIAEGKKSSHNNRSNMFLNSKKMMFLDNDTDGNLHEMIQSGIGVESEIEEKSRHEHLMSLIGKYLNSSEQEVIKLRYLNKTGEIKGLQVVGQLINLSTERVRQIEAKALVKLRKRSKGLI